MHNVGALPTRTMTCYERLLFNFTATAWRGLRGGLRLYVVDLHTGLSAFSFLFFVLFNSVVYLKEETFDCLFLSASFSLKRLGVYAENKRY